MLATLAITDSIANYGFPVAAYILMIKMYQKEREDRKEERDKWLNTLQALEKTVERMKQKMEN